MIKKLLLIFSFIILATTTFSGTTYAAQEGETIVITEELTKLINLYKEGVITEEEFSKAKSILLNPDSNLSKEKKEKKKKKKAVILKKEKLTAAERKRLKEAEENRLKAQKEQLRAEKRAEKERIKQDILDREVEIERACEEDPQSKECRSAGASLKKLLIKLKLKSSATSKKEKQERELEKQASLEEQKRIKAENAAAKRAAAAAKKAEKKRLKAERKRACKEDPESRACKEGKRKKILIF